jgi:signal transduction histidine kinase
VLAALAVPAVLDGTSEGLGAFLLAGLALYSLGAHATLRQALAGLAIFAGWAVLLTARDPAVTGGGEAARSLFYFACLLPAWAVGLLVRNPRLRALEWETRATRAERLRRELERDALAAERTRIARELHDIVAHSVSLVVLQAEAGDSRLDTDPDAARAAFHVIETAAREAMVELRRLLGVLRDDPSSDSLAPQPSLHELPRVLDTVRQAGFEVDLQMDDDLPQLAPGLELNLYRIVQEALTNSIKHSNGSRVSVLVRRNASAVEVEITDNGSGAAGPQGPAGHGLVGIRERVQLLGGRLEAGRADRGYRVWARLPLEVTT